MNYTYGFDDYLRVLRQRAAMIALAAVVAGAAGFAFAASRPSEPTTTISSEPETAVIAVDIQPFPLDATVIAERERLVMLSDQLIEEGAAGLPGSPDPSTVLDALEVTPLGSTTLLVKASDVEEATAEEVATTVAETYLDRREAQFDSEFEDAERTLELQLRSARTQSGSTLARELRISSLEGELTELRVLRRSAEVGEILTSPAYEKLVAPAPTPASPAVEVATSRSPVRDGIAGMVLGAIVAFGLALLMDLASPRFRSLREVKETLPVPVLAHVRTGERPADGSMEEVAIQTSHLLGQRREDQLVLLGVGHDASGLKAPLQQQLDRLHPGLAVVGADTLTEAAGSRSVLLVVDMGSSTRHDAERTLNVLGRSDVPVLGTIVVANGTA